MNNVLIGIFVIPPLVICASQAYAQSNVTTTTGGTAGTIPVFTSGTNVENSVITESSGNVGIGTSSPHDGLHVLTNGPTLTLEGIDHTYINLYPDGYAAGRKGWLGFGSYSFDYMTIRNEIATSGHIVLNPGSGANVGISTTTPSYKLDVNGTGRFVADGETLTLEGTNYSTIGWYPYGYANGEKGWLGYGYTPNQFYLHNQVGNIILLSDSGGSVGINNMFPDSNYTLDVNGRGRFANSLKVVGGIGTDTYLGVTGYLVVNHVSGGSLLVADPSYDQVLINTASHSQTDYELVVNDDIYVNDLVSAARYVDRTPYPKDTSTAYAAVLSMNRLPDEQYDPSDSAHQLDHSLLHPFILHAETHTDEDGVERQQAGRNLSATVSAQNEVLKDLIRRISELENRLEALESGGGSIQ